MKYKVHYQEETVTNYKVRQKEEAATKYKRGCLCLNDILQTHRKSNLSSAQPITLIRNTPGTGVGSPSVSQGQAEFVVRRQKSRICLSGTSVSCEEA